jgi:hypothetical protein
MLCIVVLSSACELWPTDLDRRDVVYNDELCHPNASGACW